MQHSQRWTSLLAVPIQRGQAGEATKADQQFVCGSATTAITAAADTNQTHSVRMFYKSN